MRLLLDTHALLWWLEDHPNLSRTADAAIGDPSNTIHVSAASVWEIAIKHKIGKLAVADRLINNFEAYLEVEGFLGLALSVRHAQVAGALPGPHRDPFDRMLIAQAILENMVLVSNEAPFDAYGVTRLW
jgi:PIN domain nuclease of toxin-antitoxin system